MIDTMLYTLEDNHQKITKHKVRYRSCVRNQTPEGQKPLKDIITQIETKELGRILGGKLLSV
jgi:hypothetical protein